MEQFVMGTTATLPRSSEDLARIGNEILHRVVEPHLTPQDIGKFVAIDVVSQAFEIDEDDYTAMSRLFTRHPNADIWLACAGQTTTCRMRFHQ